MFTILVAVSGTAGVLSLLILLFVLPKRARLITIIVLIAAGVIGAIGYGLFVLLDPRNTAPPQIASSPSGPSIRVVPETAPAPAAGDAATEPPASAASPAPDALIDAAEADRPGAPGKPSIPQDGRRAAEFSATERTTTIFWRRKPASRLPSEEGRPVSPQSSDPAARSTILYRMSN